MHVHLNNQITTHVQHLKIKVGLDVIQNYPQDISCILANARPHQLYRGDQEMGSAISYTKCSQIAELVHKVRK